MPNVYTVKYTAVSLQGQQRIGKDGQVNVLAETPVEAGDLAKGHVADKNPGAVEVNVHLVAEVAKNVVSAVIAKALGVATKKSGINILD